MRKYRRQITTAKAIGRAVSAARASNAATETPPGNMSSQGKQATTTPTNTAIMKYSCLRFSSTHRWPWTTTILRTNPVVSTTGAMLAASLRGRPSGSRAVENGPERSDVTGDRRTARKVERERPGVRSSPAPVAGRPRAIAAPRSTDDPISTAVARLDPIARDLLLVLALSVKPITREAWAEIGSRRIPGLESPSGRSLEPHCARLLAAGLVTPLRPAQTLQRSMLYTVPPEVAMTAMTEAHTRGELARFVMQRAPETSPWFDPSQAVADLRLSMAMGDAARVRIALVGAPRGNDAPLRLLAAMGRTPRPQWLALLPDDAWRIAYLAAILAVGIAELERVSDTVIEHALALGDATLNLEVARLLALRGETDRARAISGLPKWGREGVAVISSLWSGDFADAFACGQAAVASMKSRKRPALPDVEGVCHLFATLVIAAGDVAQVPAIRARVDAVTHGGRALAAVYRVAAELHDALAGAATPPLGRCTPEDRHDTWDRALADALHDLWLRPARGVFGGGTDCEGVELCARTVASHWSSWATEQGYPGPAREFAAIVAAFDGEPQAGSMATAFQRRAAWEAALASLETLAAAAVTHAVDHDTPARRELLWELVVHAHRMFVTPRIRAGGRAKRGQPVGLAQLVDGPDVDLLTDADRRVLAGALGERWRRGAARAVELDDHAAVAMIGHPRVVGPEGVSITVLRGEAKIHTARGLVGTFVELSPPALREHPIVVMQPSPERVVVYARGPELDRLAELLTRIGTLAVPDEGRDRLAQALTRLAASAAVQVDGDLPIAGTVDVAADGRPVLQLDWNAEILLVRAVVAPLGTGGPHVRPGAGSAVLVAEIEGVGMRRCTRDLALERRLCTAMLDACPSLGGVGDGALHWRTSNVGDALSIVLELDALGDTVVLQWPEGRKLATPTQVDLQHLKLRVAATPRWFELDVSVRVDERAVLRFRELLRARAGTRFVELSRGRFVALSDELRARLDDLQVLGRAHGDGLAVAPALLPALAGLADGVPDARFDDASRARLQRLREIETLEPRLPRGFVATLRPYQHEGFVWLARLAEAGLGACLADDMGLGKTVQALALLVHRARSGPALVVCPTSVVLNWVAEAARFAPTLRIIALATTDDRTAAIAKAGPRDVVVCSYTLLGGEIESLAAARFSTAIFDEAHALKNPRTQRATAARRIVAEFRLGLTGTPLENHLGELWSLFATLVPGLLGEQADFDARFAAPIATGSRATAARLRTILRPFMLRRLKSAVLEELPARTEITLRIAPSPEQRAFYEAVRRSAVEHVATLDTRSQRMGVLAEITRLRQAAIDPRVLDAQGPAGTKLDVLFERLGELRAEGHRALVFTQFLGSLAAVRDRLRTESFDFFELDGSTPPAERARRIDAFQAGEADVFLLSLRAGGTGVNLTGADYVFHLDPWWNPAVEDQATDRVHRIGQSRPVTVYRLVTAGTIEEKILELHGSKRALADDLLAGLERSTGLDLEGLLALLD